MKNNKRVTTKIVTNYKPDDNAKTKVVISGHITELHVMERSYNHLSNSKRINKDLYMDKRTGEVKEYKHKTDTGCNVRNMNRAFEKLRQIINTNFNGAINELHLTLTYAEKMEDFDTASKDFKKFWEKLHYHYPDLEFIRVIEPQHTGTWHIHVLLKSLKHCYLTLPKDEIEKLWNHGYVWISKIENNDNIGAYFAAHHKNIDVFESNTPEPSDRKCIVKNARLQFYPPNKRFYSYSKGLKKPTYIQTTYKEALELVDIKNQVYFIAKEIDLIETETGEETMVNRVARAQYNKKRKIKE